ncbi:MAG TPA: hypothetical protein VFD58_13095 [Blastocatellia bacterium]|nr:hypothetical protein [Blastocatellia bacterium]
MKTLLGKIHLIVGLLALLIFLYTGYHMRYHIHHLMEASDRLRFSLRGNHIYILWSALLNLGVGTHLKVSAVRWRAALQSAGSLLILAAPILVVLAFYYEPKTGLGRPVIFWAVVAALAGTALHAISRLKDKTWGG